MVEDHLRVVVVAPNAGQKIGEAHRVGEGVAVGVALGGGVFPAIGNGVPTGCCTGVSLGLTAGCTLCDPGDSAGVALAPGCVPAGAFGGFAAAAG